MEIDSTATNNMEAHMHELSEKRRLSSLTAQDFGKAAESPLEKSVIQQSKASCLELSAKLSTLPRELRDMVYSHLLDIQPYCRKPLKHFFPKGVLSPSPDCSTSASPSICPCSTGLAHFLNPDFVDRTTALEVLDAFKTVTRLKTGRSHYSVHWSDLGAFSKRELFHLGTTLHDLCEDMCLSIELNFADKMTEERHTERLKIGLSKATADEIQQAAQALSALRLAKPRRVTFAFVDRESGGAPKNMDNVFRTMGVPFRELKSAGFDVHLTYISCGLGWCGLGKWDLSSNGWSDTILDPWNWTLQDWSVNFTMTNDGFQPERRVVDRWTPHPHGPVNMLYYDFRQKLPLWESIRRELFQSFVEIDEAVKLVEREGGRILVDCGCEADRHTCCAYYLCHTHSG